MTEPIVEHVNASARAERVWSECILPIVTSNKGVELGLVKELLADHVALSYEAATVYQRLTGGVIASTDVDADTVISAAHEYHSMLELAMVGAERSKHQRQQSQDRRRAAAEMMQLRRRIEDLQDRLTHTDTCDAPAPVEPLAPEVGPMPAHTAEPLPSIVRDLISACRRNLVTDFVGPQPT